MPIRTLVALALLLAAAANAETPLVAADFLRSGSATPPRPDAPWEPVALPDLWRESRPGAGGIGWYRFALPAPPPGAGRLAVLASGVSSNAELFVGSRSLGASGSMEEPVAQNWNRPLLYEFTHAELTAADGMVFARLRAHAHSYDRMPPLVFGRADELRPLHERRFFRQITLSRAATVVVAALIALMSALWLGRPHDSVYGLFALAAAGWGMASLNYHVRDVPVDFWTWQRLVHGGLQVLMVVSAFLAHRLVELERPRVERALAIYLAAVLLAFALVPPAAFDALVNTLHFASMGAALYGAITLVRESTRLRAGELRVFGLATLAFLAMGAHDLAIQLGWLAIDRPRTIQYGGPLILAAFAGTLAARLVADKARAEALNVALESRVRAKQAELERAFTRTRELERERVLAGERERIMREMHDGVGGALVSALSLVERGRAEPPEVAAALRDALEEMRFLLHSLDPLASNLETVLALLRARVEPRLAAQQLRLDWQVTDLPPKLALSPEAALHVIRIVGEAFTNVLKHADARVVCVRGFACANEDGRDGAAVEIEDDGGGAPEAPAGLGVTNMERRAAALGGSLALTHGERGVRVRLWLPLEPGSAARVPRG